MKILKQLVLVTAFSFSVSFTVSAEKGNTKIYTTKTLDINAIKGGTQNTAGGYSFNDKTAKKTIGRTMPK